MNKKQERDLEADIKKFFEQIETQNTNDRIVTLKKLFDKYIHLNTCNRKMDYTDYHNIVNGAKTKFSSTSFPVVLGDKKREIKPQEQANFCLVESTIDYLNGIGCLKKIPKFDIKK